MRNQKSQLGIIAIVVLLIYSFQSTATIWRVNYNGVYVRGVSSQFCMHCDSSLQNAIDNTSLIDKDTIYLEPSSLSYGDIVISHPVVIIGNGYKLGLSPTNNDSLQKNIFSSTVHSITLDPGSDGTVIEGLRIDNNNGGLTINSTNNIVIRRNQFFAARLLFNGSSNNNILIEQNFFEGNNASINQNGFTVQNLSNVIINNNYIGCNIHLDNPADNITNLVISNNVLDYSLDYSFEGCDFYNNILKQGYVNLTPLGNSIHDNIAAAANGLPTGNNNTNSVPMASVFVAAGTDDSKWKLNCPNIYACGTGANGADMGMYDISTNSSYRLSGIPPIPTIYMLSTPSSTIDQGDIININISTRSNN